MIFLGIVGCLWRTLYIDGRKSGEVVTGGHYSITRNPLYVFSTLTAASFGVQMDLIVATICFAALCAAAFHVFIQREEQHPGTLFGPAYQVYFAHAPRFFSKLSLYQKGKTRSSRPKLLLDTFLDVLVFLIALSVFELIDHA